MLSHPFGKASPSASIPPVGAGPLRRASLVDLSVEAIQRKIADKVWTEVLPGEEAMRQDLGISRVTLRKALALLATHGWISVGGRGCHHAITAGAGVPAPVSGRPSGVGCVRCLSPVPKLDLVWSSRVIFDEIRHLLVNPSLRLLWEHHPVLWLRDPAKQLGKLTVDHTCAGWLLFRANPVIQAWFQTHRVPCVVLGPCHAGVSLPSVHVNNAALGRHSAQQAVRQGHRHVAWIAFDPSSASSLQTVAGLEAATGVKGQVLRVSIINDDLTLEGLRREVKRLLAMKDPPTLFMAMGAAQALPLLGILHALGLHVPGEVSVLVRDHDPILDRLLPGLSRYTFDWVRFGRQTAKLLSSVIGGMPVRTTQKILMPTFMAGDSLARRRSI